MDLKIKEVGCYIYSTGELNFEEYSSETNNKIRKKIDGILKEIKEENFSFQINACINCDLKIVCQIEKKRK